MRPLRLTLEGFRSYAAPTTFDFTGRRLVGVVGPIGSGKSTILDAIAFALYGKTHSQAAATKTLINQRADAGKVELIFEASGDIWRVVRVLRGQSEHAAYRYESIEDVDTESKPVERVLKKADVDARIEEVLGLDFSAFGRSVMLAQNRFAEFLSAKPSDRDVVLKGVFGFDRLDAMHTVAKRRRDDLGKELEGIDRRQKDLDNEKALLTAAEEGRALAEARHTELGRVAAELDTILATLAENGTRKDEIRRRIRALEELADRLPAADTTEKLLANASEGNAVAAQAVADVVAAEEKETQARAEHRAALEKVGGQEVLAKARALATKLAQQEDALQRQRNSIESLTAERLDAENVHARASDAARLAASEFEGAAKSLAKAQVALDAASESLRAVETSNMAGTLRSSIVVGGPCPVCHQDVLVLPPGDTADVEAVRAEYQAAHTAVDENRKRHSRLEVELAKAESASLAAAHAVNNVADRTTKSVAIEQQLAADATATADELNSLLEGEDPAVVEDRLTDLDDAVRAAGDEAAAARAAHADILRAQQSTERQLEQLVGQLHTLSGALGHGAAIGATPEQIAAGLDDLRAAWKQQWDHVNGELSAMVAEIERIEGERQDLLDSVGLAPDADFPQSLSDAKAALAARTTEVATRTERLVGADELVATAAKKLAEREIYTTLASDLTPSNFLRFLLEEERRTLSRLGSDRFEDLSGGRFRFTDDGAFQIVDLTAAEQPRKADTLSGGETFLASLALALALAEMVGRDGGRLDAFFLDEGFGSLDSEHLDLAMAGIERLVADHDNRLVVVVSHVPDMRERIEDLIELDKDPATGATLVRRA